MHVLKPADLTAGFKTHYFLDGTINRTKKGIVCPHLNRHHPSLNSYNLPLILNTCYGVLLIGHRLYKVTTFGMRNANKRANKQ